ncbi:uncharacterized protein N7473_012989 [Penicillium subrubescens]|uniref:uncharacterized protein n=1 Tax=Penicillium subrubescens TaxID=1316194 RepID=UPI002545B2F1|nr:uncharacterized protein N7473_012989 [Penicillium subrubescens]KAJ5875642.1 hypothetical protein N7473_012989 [Penicillium subrubescens]
MHHNLDEVICLLASITDRPPDPEGLNQEDSEASDLDSKSESDLYDESSDDDIEETTVLDTNSKGDQYLTELKNQFLDRLAEILARFKTVPKAKNSKDAKHVAAAMMACHEAKESVRIFCAKNEGLDHEDRKFLSEWKQHMENIAKKDHQRPRIEFYFKSLKEALQSSVQQKISQYGPNLPLKAENIQAITALDSRDWEDHNGLFFLYHSACHHE